METNFPAVAYHEDGSHKVVANAKEAKALGDGYSDQPNDNTIRNLRKASGASKTDKEPGVIYSSNVEAY